MSRLGDWLTGAESRLKRAEVSSPRLDALIIAEAVLHRHRAGLLAHLDDELTTAQRDQLESHLKSRLDRQPLAYIIGTKEFYGLDFKLTPDVLVPRPETEVLVEQAIRRAAEGGKVLDVGTGSGCIAVALKVHRPDLAVTASDVSAAALKVAALNAKLHLADIKFVLSDLFKDVQGRFDLILANLPYVPVGARRQLELDYEPPLALYGGDDGLDYYRPFLSALSSHLSKTGQAIIEAGPTQRAGLKRMAIAAGFKLSSLSEYVSLLIPR